MDAVVRMRRLFHLRPDKQNPYLYVMQYIHAMRGRGATDQRKNAAGVCPSWRLNMLVNALGLS